MTLWPQELTPFPRRRLISTYFTGNIPLNIGDYAFTQTVDWGTANRALFVPIVVREPAAIQKIGWFNGSDVIGNIDVGVYTSRGGRIISIGSTARSGSNRWQWVDVTDFLLSPGDYYLAVSLDNIEAQIGFLDAGGSAANVHNGQIAGAALQDSAFPLPSLATMGVVTSSMWPVLALSLGRY